MTPDNSTWLDSDDALKRLVALKRNGLSVEQLREAMNDEDPRVREAAVRHESMTDGLLHEALRHPDLATRRHALRHPLVNEKHIEGVLHDPELRDIISSHPATTEAHKNRLVADVMTEPEMRETLTKAVTAGVGYIHFPGLGQPSPIEAAPSSAEMIAARMRQAGDMSGAVPVGVTMSHGIGYSGMPQQHRKRGTSAYYLAGHPLWAGNRAHETQHAVFQRIAQDFGERGRDRVVEHLHRALKPEHHQALNALMSHPSVVGLYQPNEIAEEKIAYAQSYINDPQAREAFHRHLKLRSAKRKFAFQALVRGAVQRMRHAALNLKLGDMDLVKKSEEEMLKAWVNTGVSENAQPPLPHESTRFTKVETFKPRLGLYHHVYHMPHFEEEGYTPMMHVISTKPSPFDHSGIVSSATVGVHKDFEKAKGMHEIDAPLKGEVAQVHFAATSPGLRGHGYGSQLYDSMLRYHKGLVSDKEVSPAASARWQKLHATPGVRGGLGVPGEGKSLHWAHATQLPPHPQEGETIKNDAGHTLGQLAQHHTGELMKSSPPPSFPRLKIVNRRETQILDDEKRLYGNLRRVHAAALREDNPNAEPGVRAAEAKQNALYDQLDSSMQNPSMQGWSAEHKGGYISGALGHRFLNPTDTEDVVRGNLQHEDLHGVFSLVQRKYGRPARHLLAERMLRALPREHQHVIDDLHRSMFGKTYKNNAHYNEEKLAGLMNYMNSAKERERFHADHDDVQKRIYGNSLKRAYKGIMGVARKVDKKWFDENEQPHNEYKWNLEDKRRADQAKKMQQVATAMAPTPVAKAEPDAKTSEQAAKDLAEKMHDFWLLHTYSKPRGGLYDVPTEDLWQHDTNRRWNPETGEAKPISHLRGGMDKESRWAGLLSDVKAKGIHTPIEVTEREGKPYIEDGHHRLGVAMALKLPHVRVTAPPELAEKMGWKLNVKKGEGAMDWGFSGQDQGKPQTPDAPANNRPDAGGGAHMSKEFSATAKRTPGPREQPEKMIGVDSPGFKNWFGESKVTHPKTGAPLRVYHGTTHNFTAFRPDKHNPENYWGGGHYFTDAPADVAANYATKSGADLKNRVENEIGRSEYLNARSRREMNDIKREVKQQIVGPAARTIPAYLRMKNPLMLTKEGGHHYEMDWDPDTDEETGSAIQLHDAIQRVAPMYGADGDKVWHDVLDNHHDDMMSGGAHASHVMDTIRDSVNMNDVTDDEGRLQGGQFAAELARELGHDGIVMDADRFKGMKGTAGARHYITWDPANIKGVFNKTWDPSSNEYHKTEGDPNEEMHDWDQPIPNQEELAHQSIQRMKDAGKKQRALDFFDYTKGKIDKRPSIEPELERHLAGFGIVDPAGYPFDEMGHDIDRPLPGKRSKGGAVPDALAENKRQRSWADYNLPYQKSEDLEKMAIAALKPGKKHQMKMGDTEFFDYSHMLPEQAKGKYQIIVNHTPTSPGRGQLKAVVVPNDPNDHGALGAVESSVRPGQLNIDYATLHSKHRGQGLGLAMYEALMTHAYHKHKVRTVAGDNHSTAAHGVHEALARKHGMTYTADRAPYTDKEEGADFDDAYEPYSYTMKTELHKFEDQMQNVAVQQGGASTIHGPLCRAAAFLSGKLIDELRFRQALALDLEPAEAALKAAGLEPTEENLKAIHALVEIQAQEGLHKSEESHTVSGVSPEDQALAEQVLEAFEKDDVRPVNFKGKHTGGMEIARLEDGKQWLLKPGSGDTSPAAGVREETASQSQREVAFYQVGDAWGLGQWMPKTHLLEVDGTETAAMELLPLDWKNMEKLRDENPHQLAGIIEKLLHEGTLHKWAVLDYVLGNPDRHGNNLMVGAEEDGFPVKLIDHGSTFAGEAFNPGHDSSSFIPFYLRATAGKRWKTMSDQERLAAMPRLGIGGDSDLREWILQLDPHVVVDVLSKYGIRAEPSLERLQKLRAGVDSADSASRVVDAAWLGL